MSHRLESQNRFGSHCRFARAGRAAAPVARLGAVVSAAALCLGACSELELPGSDGGAAGVPSNIVVVPGKVELTVRDGKVQTQKFRAYGVFPGLTTPDASAADSGKKTAPDAGGGPPGSVDITDKVTWTIEVPTIGRFESNEFRTEVLDNGKPELAPHGGHTRVLATAAGVSGAANLAVFYYRDFYDGGAPSNADKKFSGKQSGTVHIHYPPPGLVVPPNLGQLDFQYTAGSTAHDLYYLMFSGPMGKVRIFTTKDSHNLTYKQWQAVAMSHVGLDVTYRIYSVKSSGGTVSQSQAGQLKVADTHVRGGLYYWVLEKAKAGEKPKYGSIYRYNFDKPATSAEAYYTQQEAKDCIGCHSLSRGGEKVAFTLSGGNGDAAIFDVKDKAAVHKPGKYKADIQTFNPNGTEVIVVNQGKLTRRQVKTGELLETLSTGAGKATHPDWSPDGSALVFVKVADKDYFASGYKDDVHFKNGSLYIMYRKSGKWEAPKLLKKCGNGTNCYYPTFSPKGDWILFNQSTGDSYSDADANIYMVKPDGKRYRALTGLNLHNRSNSWPRWSPFVQKYRGTTIYWLTFSSVRDYGVKLKNSKILNYDYKVPQIWMTSFDIERAEKGQDPTSPPFWLPFQDMEAHNHIAQWTEKVVTIN